MRPRQICRGIRHAADSRYGVRRASMRPRQICRGISTSTYDAVHRSFGFNEAPADLPGNCRTRIACRHDGLRFNEAPADLPGN